MTRSTGSRVSLTLARDDKTALHPPQSPTTYFTMSFARTAFWRTESTDDTALRRRFWRKARGVAAHLPFAEDLLAAYYCAFDRETPLPVKASLVGALAYFVLPVDAVPDFLPALGFTDDAAVLVTAVKLVASHLRVEHRDAAREKLSQIS